MARPIKEGLDYFPLDVVMEDKVELLEAECGLEGFAILIKLYQKIYQNSYYIEWGEDNALLFSRKINTQFEKVNRVVDVCFKRKILNKSLYEKHKILTSDGIQKRYFQIYNDARRKGLEVIKDYILVNDELMGVNVTLTRVNDNINHSRGVLNTELSTQRKGKKNKEDKSKEDKNNNDAKASEKFDYKSIYDFYLKQDNLTDHRKYTKAMAKAMKKARDEYSLTKLQMLNIIRDHNLLVSKTKGGDYEVSVRNLDVLFGQKIDKTSGSPLICAEYLKGGTKKKWLNKLTDGKASINKTDNSKKKNSFHNFEGGKDYTEKELNEQLGLA